MADALRVGNVRLADIDFHQHNVRVDLGDLRDLTESIKRFGVMQPVVLEQRGDRLRIRAGHRRVAAAQIAGLGRIPAVVHSEALDEDEWLTSAVHENTRRKGLDLADRARAAQAMRDSGMTWDAIGEAFGVSSATARNYLKRPDVAPTPARESRDERGERIEELSRQGRSAAQIADELGISTMTVVRRRTNNRSVQTSTIRRLASEAEHRVAAGEWGVTDVLAALTRLATTGALPDALSAEAPAA